jgi:signal peptidase II
MRSETPLSPAAEDPAIPPPSGGGGSDAAAMPAAEAVADTAGPAGPEPAPRARGRLLWSLTAGIVGFDQLTKALVRQHVAVFDSRPVIDGLVDIVHVRNYGVAFGVLNDMDLPYKEWITVLLALAALGGIAIYMRHVPAEERMARVGLSLILGGALGNLIDRARQGYVVDFVDVYWGQWHFWAFNVADASITIGAILVFLDLVFGKRHASHPV